MSSPDKLLWSVRMDRSLKERLAKIAKNNRRSLNNMIEIILEEAAERHEKQNPTPPKKK